MRKLLTTFILFASLAISAPATSNIVKVVLADWTASPVGKRMVTIAPRNTPATLSTTNGSAAVLSDIRTTNTPSSGIFYLSNVVAGSYTLTAAGNPTTSFIFTVTNSSAVLNAWDLRTPTPKIGTGTTGYTISQAYSILALGLTNSSGSAFFTDGEGNLSPSNSVSSDSLWTTVDGDLTPK